MRLGDSQAVVPVLVRRGKFGPIFDRELPVIVDLCLGENEFGKSSSHGGAGSVEGWTEVKYSWYLKVEFLIIKEIVEE